MGFKDQGLGMKRFPFTKIIEKLKKWNSKSKGLVSVFCSVVWIPYWMACSCNLLLNIPGPTYGHGNIDFQATYDRQGKH